MYVYIYIYKYTCSYMYYVNRQFCIRTHAYVHISIHACVYIYINTFVYMHVYSCIYIYMYMCMCICIHLHVCICFMYCVRTRTMHDVRVCICTYMEHVSRCAKAWLHILVRVLLCFALSSPGCLKSLQLSLSARCQISQASFQKGTQCNKARAYTQCRHTHRCTDIGKMRCTCTACVLRCTQRCPFCPSGEEYTGPTYRAYHQDSFQRGPTPDCRLIFHL